MPVSRIIFSSVTASALIALGACSKTAPDDTVPGPSDTAVADGSSTAPAMAPPVSQLTTAQGFADAMAAGDMFEIESSKLAATMAKDAGVKSFARMMIADHTKSSAELKAAAAKVTPAVMIVPAMTAQQQSDLDALKASGDGFDALYATKQVAAHEQALSTLRGYASGGDAEPFKAFAGKTATVVSGHLDQARALKK